MAGPVVTKWRTLPGRATYTLVAPFGGRPEPREAPGARMRCDLCGDELGEVAVTVEARPPPAGGVSVALHPTCAAALARALGEVAAGEAVGPRLRLVR